MQKETLTTDDRTLVERLRSRGWEDRQHRLLREEAARRLETIGRFIALQKAGELSVPGTLLAIEQELR